MKMLPLLTNGILALGAPPAPAGTQPNPQGQMFYSMGMLVLMVVIFYFLLIAPQRKRAKQQEELLKTIKSGDRIVTSSGIVGQVISVKEKTLSIRSADAKFEILKTAVTEISERGAEASQTT